MVTPEGEPEGPALPPEIIELIEPEYEPEQETEQSPDQEPLNEPEGEPENQPEQEPEKELELINPETGDPVPRQPAPEFIPFQDYIEQLHEQQENTDQIPDTEPEQESEIIPEQESEVTPEHESEVIPDQESEVIPEQHQGKTQKKKHNKTKSLEPITDPKELGEYKHYEYQHIVKTKYDPIFSQKQIRKPQKKPVKKPKQIQKKKPIKVKKIEPIIEKKELGEYKHYEYSHTLKTKYSQRQAQKKPEKSEKKTEKPQTPVQKKKPIKVKKIEPITDPKELGEYKHYEYSHTIKSTSTQKQASKKSEKSEKKTEISQKTKKKSKSEEIKELELIVDPIETEKGEESHESKADFSSEQTQKVAKKASEKQETDKSSEVSKEKVNEIIEQESQTQSQLQQKMKVKKQEKLKTKQRVELISSKLLELQERYRQETGKRSIYNKKETKGFKEWLEKQKKLTLKKSESNRKSEIREEWELLLEKWINEANENEISKEIKEELLSIIKKYGKAKAIYWRIIQVLKRKNLPIKETEEIEGLLKKLEKMTGIQTEIFKNLRAFRAFYNDNIRWYKNRIIAEREKFMKHLVQKLKYLKKIEKTQKVIKRNWKEILNENLYKNITLSLNEKSIINKILQKLKITESDKTDLISILSKLPTEHLISLLGQDFRQHTQNYIKWGWDYDLHLKKLILTDYFKKNEKNKTIINNEKKYDSVTLKFLILLKKTVESIFGYKIRQDIFSKEFLGQSNGHYEYIKGKSKLNPKFLLFKQELNSYEEALKAKLEKEFKKVKPIVDNYFAILEILPNRRFKIFKFHPNIDLDYFKSIDSIKKAYWFGYLLADGSLFVSKVDKFISVEMDVKDGELVKRYIQEIGFNPKYVKYYKRIFYNEKGRKIIKRTFRARFTNVYFANNLVSKGFILGKKSEKIRFPFLNKREYILACLLGFFDGDGSHVGTPTIYSKSRLFLKDIIKILNDLGYSQSFNIGKKIDNRKYAEKPVITYYLGLSGDVFNDMLDVYSNSLYRKRKIYLIGEKMAEYRRQQWRKNLALIIYNTKLKFSKKELSNLRRTLSYKKIAQLHNEKFGIRISLHTIRYWCLKWNINIDKKNTNTM
ncbi:MAG: LAGLIDADG family homing endonuclease [Candidatus Lokiarchaeia archaeon]